VTTRWDLAIEVAAYRMFERWTQENFFRYMRQHFALDALVTYAVEPADPERTVPNPQRKALAKALAKSHAVLKELEQRYGAEALANAEAQRPTMRRFKIANAELGQRIRTHQAQTQELKAQRLRRSREVDHLRSAGVTQTRNGLRRVAQEQDREQDAVNDRYSRDLDHT
jgi:hypothetical protein